MPAIVYSAQVRLRAHRLRSFPTIPPLAYYCPSRILHLSGREWNGRAGVERARLGLEM